MFFLYWQCCRASSRRQRSCTSAARLRPFSLDQFRWPLFKKASQVLYLHCALKQCEFLEEFHEKQEQISAICVTISRRYMLEEATERIGGTIHAFELADADDATVMASVKIDLRPHNKSIFTYNMACKQLTLR